MNLLFIGDIVGEPGRRAVSSLLPGLRQEFAIDFVVANGENSAGGNGITPKTAADIFGAGVDVITSGDHLWDCKEVSELLENENRFLRPFNYPGETPGHGSGIFDVNLERWSATDSRPDAKRIMYRSSLKVAVLNLQGRTFMPPLENPFSMGRDEIERLQRHTNIIFVDFHAEATSEKIAFGRMVDGQASAVVGTHTHVQTADDQILPKGTGYLSDAGFTGPHDGCLGREITPVIERFLTNQPRRFDVAKNNIMLHGAIIQIDEATGKTLKIQRVSRPL